MRKRAVLLGVAGLAVAAVPVGAAVAGDGPPSEAECRHQWADLVQLKGENGNPGGPVRELTHRWETTYDEARALAQDATADDCGPRFDDLRAAWNGLEAFQYKLSRFDFRGDLRGAEADRRHYQDLHSPGEPPHHLSPALKHAFRVIRHQTPGAVRDLEPALEPAPDVDVRDSTQVRDFMRTARAAKRASVHVDRMRHPYWLIGQAELDEE
jgi:hypothetical protein